MTTNTSVSLGQIHALLAKRQYAVREVNESVLNIQEVESGISLSAVLQGEILFLSLVCMVAPAKALTAGVMKKMLGGDNGISTSHFQLYESGNDQVAVTLSNFCKLQDLGSEDEDDILSCISFLLADVVQAKNLIGADLSVS